MFVGKLLCCPASYVPLRQSLLLPRREREAAGLLVNGEIHRSCDARGGVGRNHLELDEIG